MSKVISYVKNGMPHQVEDDWQVIKNDPQLLEAGLPVGKVIVPFAWWVSHHQDLNWAKKIQAREVAVWFGVEDDIQLQADTIQPFFAQWPLIAVDFPIYRDGRGFSTAAILRKRLNWQGEVRAIGDVLVDQLIQMARVGFDSFHLRVDQSVEVALAQYAIYHVQLQNDWRNRRSQLSVVA